MHGSRRELSAPVPDPLLDEPTHVAVSDVQCFGGGSHQTVGDLVVLGLVALQYANDGAPLFSGAHRTLLARSGSVGDGAMRRREVSGSTHVATFIEPSGTIRTPRKCDPYSIAPAIA